MSCPLCLHQTPQFFWRDRRREYWSCPNCSLVFVPESFHLSDQAEKAEYDLHQNNLSDDGYLTFLSRMATPLLARVSSGRGLDFGCGPAPALAELLKKAGLEVFLYDKFYYSHPELLEQSYQFITATEVVEHLSRPGETLDKLWQQLEPGGYLGIMTKRWDEPERFYRWHYKNDPTHISFFHIDSFRWLAQRWHASLEVCSADVVIFKKAGR